jgi:hypothetical protein
VTVADSLSFGGSQTRRAGWPHSRARNTHTASGDGVLSSKACQSRPLGPELCESHSLSSGHLARHSCDSENNETADHACPVRPPRAGGDSPWPAIPSCKPLRCGERARRRAPSRRPSEAATRSGYGQSQPPALQSGGGCCVPSGYSALERDWPRGSGRRHQKRCGCSWSANEASRFVESARPRSRRICERHARGRLTASRSTQVDRRSAGYTAAGSARDRRRPC